MKSTGDAVHAHGGDPADAVPTRHRVLEAILTMGPSTAAELAEELNLTPAAIRRHLADLVDGGLLSSREQRIYGPRGRGRPASVFTLTDEGRAAFHHSYDEFANQALAHLLEVAGPEAVDALAAHRVEPVVRLFTELQETNAALTPVQALTAALSADGYVASATPVESGVQICQHHCPVANVAEQFPALCEIETQVFSQLLRSHVQRLATIAHGDGVCTTHVPRPITQLEADIA